MRCVLVVHCLHLTMAAGGAGDETDWVSLLRNEGKDESNNKNKDI
jgi:hypothetical protein